MSEPHEEPFGTLLGIAPGGVAAYSSDYDTVDEREMPDRSAFRSYLDGIYMGYKWQCVEFARRWFYVNRGWIFDDVAMAYEIFRLRDVRDVKNNRNLPMYAFRNGARRRPEPGSLLIWSEGGMFERTGHVAVITEVFDDRVRVAEQNVEFEIWPEGQDWSREIPARITAEGEYWLRDSIRDATVLGWMIQTDDPRYAETEPKTDRRLFRLVARHVHSVKRATTSWLNVANPDEAAYVAMNGQRLGVRDDNQSRYMVISESALSELRRATNELHSLFMHATEYVLQDDARLERFNIPRVIWPRIRNSWDNRRNQMITGRFDFAMTERGIRVYEYNCDSASCHMDTGKVQGKWASAYGCDVGRDAGARLFADLVEAWRESEAGETLHIMADTDPEEQYHALYMKEALDAAGVQTRMLEGVQGLAWTEAGDIVDADGVPIRWVWKTWAWETALDQIRAECEDDEHRLDGYEIGARRTGAPRLVDVLLRPEVMVFEPLWTLIPSNKAILPLVWKLFNDRDYLLNTAYDITPSLRASGYVSKPIVGRCGSNISLYDTDESLVMATDGGFESRDNIYQELFALPLVDDDYAQLCTFTAGGSYAGTCVRIDPSMVITGNSDIVALRVVNDNIFLEDYSVGS